MKQSWSKFLKIYIFPIVTLAIFTGIILFLVIPKISEIFAAIDQVKIDNEEVAAINTEIADLSNLQNNTELSSNLALLNELASNGATRVVEFRDKMAANLSQFNLTVNTQRISESSFINADLRDSIILIEIPFEFSVTGTLDNVKAFITSLSTLSDFAIVKELDIAKEEGESWNMKIILVKYQFAANPNDEELYSNIDPTTRIPQNIQEFLETRK